MPAHTALHDFVLKLELEHKNMNLAPQRCHPMYCQRRSHETLQICQNRVLQTAESLLRMQHFLLLQKHKGLITENNDIYHFAACKF